MSKIISSTEPERDVDGGYLDIGSWLIFQSRLIIIAMDELPFHEMSAVIAFILLLLAARVRRRLYWCWKQGAMIARAQIRSENS